jgi:hypothetical protein
VFHWLGPGKIVEIDKAKIGKQKYNRAHFIEGQWLFQGIERDTGIFLLGHCLTLYVIVGVLTVD